MTWVLLIGLYLRGDGGGVSLSAVEFKTEAACKAAGKALADEWSRDSFSLLDQSRWVCVPKGD